MPVVARLLMVNLTVELPLPPEMEVGLKETVAPLFWPDAERLMEVIVPCVTAVVILEVPDDPLLTVSDVGPAPIVKLEGAAVTVRVKEVVSIVVPSEPVPVTVMV